MVVDRAQVSYFVVRPRFVGGRHNFNVHSGWLMLNFAEANREITDQNIKVFHFLHVFTRQHLQIGSGDRLLRDNQV